MTIEMNTAQIAAKLSVSERTIQRWIKSGKLPAQEGADHRYLIEESDLEALMLPPSNTTAQQEIISLRAEFYDLAHQVSELERILEQIVESLTALPEQLTQARLTVPLQMEDNPSSAEARIAELERRVSELERSVGR